MQTHGGKGAIAAACGAGFQENTYEHMGRRMHKPTWSRVRNDEPTAVPFPAASRHEHGMPNRRRQTMKFPMSTWCKRQRCWVGKSPEAQKTAVVNLR